MIICPGVNLVWFHLVRDLLCFLYLGIWFLLSFGKFSVIFPLNSFTIPFPVFLPLDSLSCEDWQTSNDPIVLIYCFHFFLFVLLSAILTGRFPLFYLPDHLFFLPHYLVWYLLPLAQFLSQQMSFPILIGCYCSCQFFVTVICICINKLS